MDEPKPKSTEPTPESQNVNQSYVNEPETYETPTGEPVTLTPSQDPQFAVKKKSGAKKWLLTGLVALLLAAVGALAYWQWAEAENAKKEVASLQTSLATAQAANKEAAEDKTETAEPAPELTDQEEVVMVAKEFTEVRTDNQFTTLSEEDVVLDTSKQYAKATLAVGTSTEGGYTIVAKKLKDSWVVIYGGVTMTTEQKNNLVKEFSVPETLLADS